MESPDPGPMIGEDRQLQSTAESSLLLELGVPFGRRGNDLLVEVQALNGMRLWAKHFERVTVCATEMPAGGAASSTIVWADPCELLADGRVVFEPLPNGYHPRDHFRFRQQVCRRFAALVPAHRYLCFSNLGAFGAWGNIAAATARAQRRPYSLWFDWVVHEMIGQESSATALRAVRNRAYAAITQRQTHQAIRACALGLFHGQTVYDAYAPLCRQPALVHDVHVHPEDAISDGDLAAKLAELPSRSTLRVGYVGRVHPMKAPLQWIDAMAEAIAALDGERIQATWLGDGPLLEDARARVLELGLERSIRFVGFVSGRAEVLSFLRHQDVFAFCHITPESPRCLIEALLSAAPLVGYESSYAHELVGSRGGAALSPIGDARALARNLVKLASDRQALKHLALCAATARAIYNDEAVFLHRSSLIKRHLP